MALVEAISKWNIHTHFKTELVSWSSIAYPLYQWVLPCALNSGKSQRMNLAFKSIPQIKWKRLKSPRNVNSSQTVFALQKGRSRSQTECTHLLSLPPPEGKAIKMNFFSGLGIVSALFQPETSSTSSNSGNFRCEILHQSSGGKTVKKKKEFPVKGLHQPEVHHS